jgi:predicted MPP superfamily phosphohydrolase
MFLILYYFLLLHFRTSYFIIINKSMKNTPKNTLKVVLCSFLLIQLIVSFKVVEDARQIKRDQKDDIISI